MDFLNAISNNQKTEKIRFPVVPGKGIHQGEWRCPDTAVQVQHMYVELYVEFLIYRLLWKYFLFKSYLLSNNNKNRDGYRGRGRVRERERNRNLMVQGNPFPQFLYKLLIAILCMLFCLANAFYSFHPMECLK